MKKTCTLLTTLALALGGLTATTSADTIAEIVAGSGGAPDMNPFDYDSLLTALQAVELDGALDNPDDDLTVFGPNDLAFFNTARDLGYTGRYDEGEVLGYILGALDLLDGDDGDGSGLLSQVLLYHVAGERINAIQFILRGFFRIPVQTLQGGTFQPAFLRLIDNDPDVPNPRLFWPINVNASNGIIHTINRILIPLDITLPE